MREPGKQKRGSSRVRPRGKYIQELIYSKGYDSLKSFAEAKGLKERTVDKVVGEKGDVERETLRAFATALNEPYESLVKGTTILSDMPLGEGATVSCERTEDGLVIQFRTPEKSPVAQAFAEFLKKVAPDVDAKLLSVEAGLITFLVAESMAAHAEAALVSLHPQYQRAQSMGRPRDASGKIMERDALGQKIETFSDLSTAEKFAYMDYIAGFSGLGRGTPSVYGWKKRTGRLEEPPKPWQLK
jgi:hypothetical protein